MKRKLSLFTVFFYIFITQFAHANNQLKIIQTHQKAETYLVKLQQLFDNQARITAHDHHLMVKAANHIIQEIEYILKKIDRPLYLLKISLKEVNQPYITQLKNTKNKSKIYSTRQSFVSSTTLERPHKTLSTSIEDQRLISELTVQEGSWAQFISSKNKKIMKPVFIVHQSKGKHITQKSFNHPVHIELNEGLQAKVRVIEPEHIEIDLQMQKLDNEHRKTQQLTTINGRFGDWINILKTIDNNKTATEKIYAIKIDKVIK